MVSRVLTAALQKATLILGVAFVSLDIGASCPNAGPEVESTVIKAAIKAVGVDFFSA